MNNWIKRIGIKCLVTVGVLIAMEGQAQDIQYSQFYSNVLYLNPAFAGNAHATRGVFHQRVQWPALDAKYITSHISVDNYFSKSNSGLGLMIFKDMQGGSTISSVESALQYAYELHLNSTYSFRAGFQASYVSRYVNYSYLQFPDQYNDYGYLGQYTNQPFGSDNIQYADFSAGGIFYSDNYWIGIASNHLNRPNQSFSDKTSRLPMKLDFTGGYRIDFEKKNELREVNQGRDVYLTPTFHYKLQGKSDQVDLGMYFLYDHLITGFWYRGIPILKNYRNKLQNNESFVAQIGWRVDGLSICYSYDFTISKLSNPRTGGSHEINLTYLYNKPSKKKKPMKRIPCPHFYK